MLTAKQEKFSQLIASEGMSQVAAYVDAGYQSAAQRKTLIEGASRLAADSNILTRIKEIRSAASERAVVTLDGHLASLADIRDMALAGDKTAQGNTVKNYGAAVQAETTIGKHSGVAAPDKHQDVTPDVPAEEAITELCTQNGVLNTPAHKAGMEMLRLLNSPVPYDVEPEPSSDLAAT